MIKAWLTRIEDFEDNLTERKPESDRRVYREAIVALANTVAEGSEGVLFIGVADDGTRVGVQNPDALQKTIRHICEQQCFPPVAFRTEVDSAAGPPIVAVFIPPSKAKPHFTGPAFVRKGCETVKASEQMFQELVLNHVDKCRQLLAHRDEIWTVHGLGRKVGDPKPLGDGYREGRECRVQSCTAHSVRLFDIGTNERLSESLDAIRILHDEKRDRPMIVAHK